MTKELVQPDQILAPVGKTSVHAPFVQRAGLWLAACVGILISAVTVGVLGFLYVNFPDSPAVTEQSTTTIEQYKELSTIAIQGSKEIFQTIVTQALLPVFTAILGYIFARGGAKSSSGG